MSAEGQANIVLTMTADQAGVLARAIDFAGVADNPWLEAVNRHLSDMAMELSRSPLSLDASVFAEAEAVVAGLQIEIAAEREATHVADAAATAERSVADEAVTAAEVALGTRMRKAHAATAAAREAAETASKAAAAVQARAETQATNTADAAAQQLRPSWPTPLRRTARRGCRAEGRRNCRRRRDRRSHRHCDRCSAVATAVAAAAVDAARLAADAETAFEPRLPTQPQPSGQQQLPPPGTWLPRPTPRQHPSQRLPADRPLPATEFSTPLPQGGEGFEGLVSRRAGLFS